MLIPTTSPTTWPITRAQAFAQCALHVTYDAEHDDLVDRLIKGACAAVGDEARLVLSPTGLERRLDGWPGCAVELEAGPVREVVAIKYLDAAEAEQTVDAAQWGWEPSADGALVWFKPAFDAPALADRPGAVRIQFEAGFNDPNASESGEARLDVPRQAIEAALICVAAWFEVREQGEIPAGALRLIKQIKVFR